VTSPSPSLPRLHRLDALAVVPLVLFAAVVRRWEAWALEVPFDASPMLHRTLDLRDGVAIPLSGNLVVGWPFRFGVFDDWYRALWTLGTDTLLAFTHRQVASHALIAAWAYLLCARLGARAAGVLLALWVALDSELIVLTTQFPSTYRTAEWGLLLALAIVALAADHPRRGSGPATVGVVLAAALLLPSHPFAAAAAVPAGLALARWGARPSRRATAWGLAGLLVLAGPWIRDTIAGIGPFLGARFESAGHAADSVSLVQAIDGIWRPTLELFGVDGHPARWLIPLVLAAGLVGAALRPAARPLLGVGGLWLLGFLGMCAVAGYSPRAYHMLPPVLVLVAAALVGIERGLATAPRSRWLGTAALAALTVALLAGPFGAALSQHRHTAAQPWPRGAAWDADQVAAEALRLFGGEPGLFAFAWSERRHRIAEATPVALRLMTGDPEAGRDRSGPLVLAYLSRDDGVLLPGFHPEARVRVDRDEWIHLARVPLDVLQDWAPLCRRFAVHAGVPVQLSGTHLHLDQDVAVACSP